MTNLSTGRKLTILGKIVLNHAGRSRTGSALLQAGKSTAVRVGNILHLLWLQVTGFVFLAIAMVAGFACYREYVQFQIGKVGPGRSLLAGTVTLMFAWFGVSSFWRATKK